MTFAMLRSDLSCWKDRPKNKASSGMGVVFVFACTCVSFCVVCYARMHQLKETGKSIAVDGKIAWQTILG